MSHQVYVIMLWSARLHRISGQLIYILKYVEWSSTNEAELRHEHAHTMTYLYVHYVHWTKYRKHNINRIDMIPTPKITSQSIRPKTCRPRVKDVKSNQLKVK